MAPQPPAGSAFAGRLGVSRWLSAAGFLLACSLVNAADLQQQALPPLPQPLSNNAVAQLSVAGRPRLYSFFGLGHERSASAISRNAYEFDPDTNRWHALPSPPGGGRLGSVAIGLDRSVFVFGGYSLSAGGAERAIADVFRFDPLQQTYEAMPSLPRPVAGTVAMAWQGRHILLVSGWDQEQPQARVQWFDTVSEQWLAELPYPGTPVFGHAGGMLDNELVVCGGAYVTTTRAGKPQLALSDACWYGRLNPKQRGDIQWKQLPTMPGPGRFHAAALGTRLRGKHIVFAGGTDVLYRVDGSGLDNRQPEPLANVVAYNLVSRRWEEWGSLPTATMDVRGLLEWNGGLVTVGGMEAGPKVTPVVRRFVPPNRRH